MTLRWTLRAQLLAWMGLCAAVLAVVFAGLIWREQQSFVGLRGTGDALVERLVREGMEQRGAALAVQLARAVGNPLYYLDFDRIGESAGQVQAQADVVEVLVTDADGLLVNDGRGDLAGFGRPMPPLAPGSDRAGAVPGGGEATLHLSLIHI